MQDGGLRGVFESAGEAADAGGPAAELEDPEEAAVGAEEQAASCQH